MSLAAVALLGGCAEASASSEPSVDRIEQVCQGRGGVQANNIGWGKCANGEMVYRSTGPKQ